LVTLDTVNLQTFGAVVLQQPRFLFLGSGVSGLSLGHIFTTALSAVIPVVLLILLGYILNSKGFLTVPFLKVGNRLIFQICLPVMLFVNVYRIENMAQIPWDVVAYCMIAIVIIFFLGLVSVLTFVKAPERKGVILQCTFRSNYAVIGTSIAAALGGEAAQGVVAIISAFTIPLFNVLAVIALSVFIENGDGNHRNPKGMVLDIIKNPLIIGVVAGLCCLIIRSAQMQVFGRLVFSLQRDMPSVYSALGSLKAIASPLALLVLGGQFTFSAVKALWKDILLGTFWRVILAPLIGVGGALVLSQHLNLIDCGVDVLPALIALFGSPVAVSSAIMAGQMGNDEQLATQLVVWTSLAAMITVFLQICVLMATGFLII